MSSCSLTTLHFLLLSHKTGASECTKPCRYKDQLLPTSQTPQRCVLSVLFTLYYNTQCLQHSTELHNTHYTCHLQSRTIHTQLPPKQTYENENENENRFRNRGKTTSVDTRKRETQTVKLNLVVFGLDTFPQKKPLV